MDAVRLGALSHILEELAAEPGGASRMPGAVPETAGGGSEAADEKSFNE